MNLTTPPRVALPHSEATGVTWNAGQVRHSWPGWVTYTFLTFGQSGEAERDHSFRYSTKADIARHRDVALPALPAAISPCSLQVAHVVHAVLYPYIPHQHQICNGVSNVRRGNQDRQGASGASGVSRCSEGGGAGRDDPRRPDNSISLCGGPDPAAIAIRGRSRQRAEPNCIKAATDRTFNWRTPSSWLVVGIGREVVPAGASSGR